MSERQQITKDAYLDTDLTLEDLDKRIEFYKQSIETNRLMVDHFLDAFVNPFENMDVDHITQGALNFSTILIERYLSLYFAQLKRNQMTVLTPPASSD